ncbi:hypothetical protein Y032_0098g3110 [Ancylostoma ceylanicum]|uniref:Uncharacterized protein n=1 Tax=Ancylostoma ceylanicum TaxID=53326 RepID=A0A016TJB4_9BILA|nr:hypothetical protein Y032_0098g3110 [Ancylostoma ceylanicum]
MMLTFVTVSRDDSGPFGVRVEPLLPTSAPTSDPVDQNPQKLVRVTACWSRLCTLPCDSFSGFQWRSKSTTPKR